MFRGKPGSVSTASFFGRNVLAATFVLAIFGWGVGFYGPPIYLHSVVQRTGWSVPLVSSAVTVHFLVGTVVVANLPRLYRRFGLPTVIRVAAVLLALGVMGWALAAQPWQLFMAAVLSGVSWVALGAVTVNALIAQWFVTTRPSALAMAYNGASVGGVLFSPLLVSLIANVGFVWTSALVGVCMVLVLGILSRAVFSRTPEQMGQEPDGGQAASQKKAAVNADLPDAQPLAHAWTDRRFLTLTAGMALGLFAQTGMIAHLFSLLVPLLGAQLAGVAMGLVTATAIAGRTVVGSLMPAHADRRLVACCSCAIQIVGSMVLMSSGGNVFWVWAGVLLFGCGIGNATSLPPLIVQSEFSKHDTQRVIALMVAVSQATYAFGPAGFGFIRHLNAPSWLGEGAVGSGLFFAAVIGVQLVSIACFAAGRTPRFKSS